ncbi:unnamed protein product [Clonostachys chloroleuca]|uniref:Uncharacterized protein n=1 Tax=Clonostachys chloroleuca TaxID=1926264 RepID=A0AA35QB37_9HYPO|nr:unnamed protein product [Clonostachys chloroleuca]
MDLSWGRLDWHNVLANSIARPPSSFIPHRSTDGQQSVVLRVFSNVLNDSSRQWIHATSATDGIDLLHVTDQRHESILSTAELYRLAALLYLQRVVPLEGDKDRRETYLERALAILSDAKRVSSPWPCFIIACKVKMEDQRSQILDILDTMETTRKIGNVHITRVIIETIWKQKDLRGPSEPFGWWSCPDFGLSIPWFA